MRVRTGYSFRYAYGFLPDVMARIQTPYAPITDRGSMFGFNPWRKLCEENGKRPIYGVELAVTPQPGDKRPAMGYATFLAGKELEPLNKLYGVATSQFRYEPLLTYADLARLDPDIHCVLGRMLDPELLPDREFFVAVGPGQDDRLVALARARGWKEIACSNNLYPAPEDRHPYQLIMDRGQDLRTWPQYIMDDGELAAYVSPEAFANRDELAERCTAEMQFSHTFMPDVDMTLEEWCDKGAKKLGIDLTDPVYAARLERELKIINDKGYQGYFLIIADLTRFARRNMIVGPARGSAAGSLVCYLMEITTVDPIVHDLLFERFLDPGRTDLPDIDMDFSDQNRSDVIDYLVRKYGRERVCQLGTVAFYRARSMINEIAVGALRIPRHKLERVQASAEDLELKGGSDNVARFWNTFENTAAGQDIIREFPDIRVLKRIEKHPRHASRHASGVVVTEEPVTKYVALDTRSMTPNIDRVDAEELNILKIDVLGLKQLSIFEDCLTMIGKPRRWLETIPLDDPKAFEVLNRGHFSGVFQFNGHALQGIANEIEVTEFEDLVSITSLARPGPMNSGGTERWINIRKGKEEVSYYHPALKPILEATYGIVVYQEQVMKAVLEVGGFDWPKTIKLRKAIQYFGGAETVNKWRDDFVQGAKVHGVPEAVSNVFWDDMLAYGSYAFNRSHAVSYAMLSYWCCYLKAHHPVEYAAGMLNHEDDPERMRLMLVELEQEGVGYTPVDPKRSGMKWQVADGRLIGPITLVKGLGPKTAKAFINAREEGKELPKRAITLLESPLTPLDTLTPVSDAISRNYPDLTEIKIFNKPTPVSELGTAKIDGALVTGLVTQAKVRPDPKGGQRMSGVLRDDTGEVRFFISARKFPQLANRILDAGKIGETLWAIKGTLADGGGMIFADNVRGLGSLK